MQKEGNWGKHTVFYSTSIDPEKREEREQKRENKATETRKKRRKKKARSKLHQYANPSRGKNQQGTPTHLNQTRAITTQVRKTQTTNTQG